MPVTTFPWRPVDSLLLWIDGDQFYPRMLACIASAQSNIEFETYLVTSGAIADRFVTALIEAAQRGVVVRVLADSIGARGFSSTDHQKLLAAGVGLHLYNPLQHKRFAMNLARDHRKILVIDKKTAFIGGAGITNEFDPGISGDNSWHDLMLETTGAVVGDWAALFEQTWTFHHGPPSLPVSSRLREYLRRHALMRPLTGVASQTRVNGSQGDGNEQIKGDLVKRIRNARRRVWLATAYFYPSHKLRQALVKSAQRGVDVRLLLPGPHTDHPAVRYASRRYYGHLLRQGVMIYEYQPRFMHMKVALADDWVSLGSCNFDRWNLRWNLEANQEIIDEAFAGEIRRLFEVDFDVSQTLSYATWRNRSWWDKGREHFWYRVAKLIDYLSLRLRLRK